MKASAARKMDPSDRIAKEFNRLLALEHRQITEWRYAEQVVWYVLVARCEKDTNGFGSIFEQGLNLDELGVLITGLRRLGEDGLADEFARTVKLLQHHNFFSDRVIPEEIKPEIESIGERVGDRLWDLDEKLVALLDAPG